MYLYLASLHLHNSYCLQNVINEQKLINFYKLTVVSRKKLHSETIYFQVQKKELYSRLIFSWCRMQTQNKVCTT